MADPSCHDAEEGAVTSRPDTFINKEAAVKYWNGVSKDNVGVLGGYPQVSRIDLRGSNSFLAKLRKESSHTQPLHRVVDTGAGIGRVTAGFLSHIAEIVDIVEPASKLAARVRDIPKAERGPARIGEIYEVGLESWIPEVGAYDLIWNQWCVGHLTDSEFIAYLKRSIGGLKHGAWICVKENLTATNDGADLYDEVDSSVTRSDTSFKRIFEQAGLKIAMEEVQKGIPKHLGLCPIKTYALQPR